MKMFFPCPFFPSNNDHHRYHFSPRLEDTISSCYSGEEKKRNKNALVENVPSVGGGDCRRIGCNEHLVGRTGTWTQREDAMMIMMMMR